MLFVVDDKWRIFVYKYAWIYTLFQYCKIARANKSVCSSVSSVFAKIEFYKNESLCVYMLLNVSENVSVFVSKFMKKISLFLSLCQSLSTFFFVSKFEWNFFVNLQKWKKMSKCTKIDDFWYKHKNFYTQLLNWPKCNFRRKIADKHNTTFYSILGKNKTEQNNW